MSHRVILVRGTNAQVVDAGDRQAMEVYRALRTQLPIDEVDIIVVEPRTTIWMVPAVWRDARRRGLSRAESWRQIRRLSHNAVVVDGQVVFTGTPPHPVEAVAVVRDALARV